MSSVAGSPVPSATPNPQPALSFPREAITGTLGELAQELSKGTEIPEEFIFAAALTCFGSIASGSLTLQIGLDNPDTRLYTVLLGETYSVKKSSAMRRAIQFFDVGRPDWTVIHGIGSAEGLANTLKKTKVLLAFDELKALIQKSKVQSSVIMPMLTSLFEDTRWENHTKDSDIVIQNGRLALIGCCTTATYEDLWSTETIAIGMPNRLFVVNADAKPRVAFPESPDEKVLTQLRYRIHAQLDGLPFRYSITPEAKKLWQDWYYTPKLSEHTKRLDTIGFRMMPILARTMDKDIIDADVIERLIMILDYELKIRIVTDPIDADNTIAKLEEKIRRQLQSRGPLSPRDLKHHVNAVRYGTWAFSKALENVLGAHEVAVTPEGRYISSECGVICGVTAQSEPNSMIPVE